MAFELNPGMAPIGFNVAVTHSLMCDYAEAEKYFNKTLLINPAFIAARWQKSLMYLKWEGKTGKAREPIAELLKISESVSDPLIFETSAILDIYDGNFKKA